jgi:hypothetical protein
MDHGGSNRNHTKPGARGRSDDSRAGVLDASGDRVYCLERLREVTHSRLWHLFTFCAYWFALTVMACVILLVALPMALGGFVAEKIHRGDRP